MATTTPKQFRVYPETVQAIKSLQEKTGMGTADLLKAMQSAYEKVGSDGQGKDTVKARIENVQGHFMAVIAELEAMAKDLQAHHESDLQKVLSLEEANEKQVQELAEKDKEIADLRKQVKEFSRIVKESGEALSKLKAENEKLKDKIMAKLEKL